MRGTAASTRRLGKRRGLCGDGSRRGDDPDQGVDLVSRQHSECFNLATGFTNPLVMPWRVIEQGYRSRYLAKSTRKEKQKRDKDQVGSIALTRQTHKMPRRSDSSKRNGLADLAQHAISH
ncbi:hypothetical protein VTN00DRAFT_5492 [Thermoascus crustaceus]|uniref:uncharacterized protein n=1 Tax=Thermoascus crustaceus TaxID=5088 RepID=UPI0037431278